MKKLTLVIALLIVAFVGWTQLDHSTESIRPNGQASDALAIAYAERKSDVQVRGNGVVVRILPDDRDGSRHQRFILQLDSGQTLLISHNIDLAPRIASLRKGDAVAFNGKYEWNPNGGVVHWTHHDPIGRHEAGWVEHNGRTYQ